MTLDQYLIAHPTIHSVKYPTYVKVFTTVADWDLCHLDDYVVVAALSGPSFNLVQRHSHE